MNSAWYVYAIVRRDTPLPATGAATLAMVPWGELAAVTGRIRDDGAPATIEAMLRHEAIVEAVRRRGPALPVRFGTVLPDTMSVASALAERYEPLAADLDRLGDKVELSLTALWSAPPSDDEGGGGGELSAGARYLYACAAQLRRDDALKKRAGAVAQELSRLLGERGWALEQRLSLVPTLRVAVRTTYLLDPAQVGEFRADLDVMCRGVREVRFVLTGPRPPYSFVNQR